MAGLSKHLVAKVVVHLNLKYSLLLEDILVGEKKRILLDGGREVNSWSDYPNILWQKLRLNKLERGFSLQFHAGMILCNLPRDF